MQRYLRFNLHLQTLYTPHSQFKHTKGKEGAREEENGEKWKKDSNSPKPSKPIKVFKNKSKQKLPTCNDN